MIVAAERGGLLRIKWTTVEADAAGCSGIRYRERQSGAMEDSPGKLPVVDKHLRAAVVRKRINIAAAHVMTCIVVGVAIVLAKIERIVGIDAVAAESVEPAVGDFVESVAVLIVHGNGQVACPVICREDHAVKV